MVFVPLRGERLFPPRRCLLFSAEGKVVGWRDLLQKLYSLFSVFSENGIIGGELVVVVVKLRGQMRGFGGALGAFGR